jgi:hypothetical protein
MVDGFAHPIDGSESGHESSPLACEAKWKA